jgi:hypothetical protein
VNLVQLSIALAKLGFKKVSSGIASINGKTGSSITLTAADVQAVGVAIPWAASATGGTPQLTSGTAVLGAVYINTTAGVTTFNTAIDGIPSVAKDDMFVGLTTGKYTLVPAGRIVGIFSSAANLQTAFPASSNIGALACVGTGAPYSLYWSDGSAWNNFAASGGTGTSVDLFSGNSFNIAPNGGGLTAFTSTGCATGTIVGTATARSAVIANVGYYNRIGIVSAAAANSSSYICPGTTGATGTAPNTGTYAQTIRGRVVFCVSDALTACRVGAGFHNATPSTTTEPSAQTNAAWFAADSTDMQLSFMVNAGSGTATKYALNGGTGFPANSTNADVYDGYIEFAGGTTRTIKYYIKNRATGVTASGTVTTGLPVADVALRVGVYRNTAANTTAAAVDIVAVAGGGYAQMGPIA